MLKTTSDRQDIMETDCTRMRTRQVQWGRDRLQTGHHEAWNNQVEDVVELATLYANRERDVDIHFRTAFISLLVSLGRYSFNITVVINLIVIVTNVVYLVTQI